jgi:hypothetical protein
MMVGDAHIATKVALIGMFDVELKWGKIRKHATRSDSFVATIQIVYLFADYFIHFKRRKPFSTRGPGVFNFASVCFLHSTRRCSPFNDGCEMVKRNTTFMEVELIIEVESGR